jgi:hypothetical protein
MEPGIYNGFSARAGMEPRPYQDCDRSNILPLPISEHRTPTNHQNNVSSFPLGVPGAFTSPEAAKEQGHGAPCGRGIPSPAETTP